MPGMTMAPCRSTTEVVVHKVSIPDCDGFGPGLGGIYGIDARIEIDGIRSGTRCVGGRDLRGHDGQQTSCNRARPVSYRLFHLGLR